MNVLYILMRTDLPSMNAGKAMAQASHASNAFIHKYKNRIDDVTNKAEIEAWAKETEQGFGTVLVLAVTGPELEDAVDRAHLMGFPADRVLDPSYPYRVNGEIAKLIDPNPENGVIYEGNKEYTLYRSEHTCGYILGDKDCLVMKEIVGQFKLHQ